MKTLCSSITLLFGLAALDAHAAPAAAAAPLSHEEIKSTVDSHIGDVKACIGKHGAATGKLVVEFSISPDGKVNDPKPKERSSNDALDKCIARAFGGWTFPRPRGGALMGVDYPFTFAAPKAPPAQGSLDAKLIVGVVKSHLPELEECMAEGKAEINREVTGTVNVAMVISPAGAISEAKVHDSNTQSKKLDECVVKKLKGWSFPKPTGGEAAVIYPFVFSRDRKTTDGPVDHNVAGAKDKK
jgi:outer membrane biosynthesis protein TonB